MYYKYNVCAGCLHAYDWAWEGELIIKFIKLINRLIIHSNVYQFNKLLRTANK